MDRAAPGGRFNDRDRGEEHEECDDHAHGDQGREARPAASAFAAGPPTATAEELLERPRHERHEQGERGG